MPVPPAVPPTVDGDTVASVELDSATRSELRAQAHHLKPVVMIGDAGLTEAVLAETDRALKAHQLIKLRVLGDDRDQREAIMTELCQRLGCSPVQSIGKLLVVWRAPSDEDLAASQPKRRKPRKPVNKKKAEARSELKRAGKLPAKRAPRVRPRDDDAPGAGRGSAARPAAGSRSAAGAAGARGASGDKRFAKSEKAPFGWVPSGRPPRPTTKTAKEKAARLAKAAAPRAAARGSGLSAVKPSAAREAVERFDDTRATKPAGRSPARPAPARAPRSDAPRSTPAGSDAPRATPARSTAERIDAWFGEGSPRPAPRSKPAAPRAGSTGRGPAAPRSAPAKGLKALTPARKK